MDNSVGVTRTAYLHSMGKMPFVDDMPGADEAYGLAHRQESLDLTDEVAITNVRVGYTGRLVGTISDGAVRLANYAFTAPRSAQSHFGIRRDLIAA